jgi:ethanolamine transporter EutH
MENEKMSAGRVALNYGLILGVVLIIYSLILYLLDVPLDALQYFNWVSYIFIIVAMVLGIRTYRDKYAGGFITYGKSFSTGFLIGLYASIIAAIYGFIYFSYINPGIVQEMMDARTIEMLEQNPNMNDEQVEIAQAWMERFMSPVMMSIMGLIVNVIVSLVISLIVSIFTQKKDASLEGTA